VLWGVVWVLLALGLVLITTKAIPPVHFGFGKQDIWTTATNAVDGYKG